METYLEKRVLSDPLRDPVIRQAIRELGLSKGSRLIACSGSHPVAVVSTRLLLLRWRRSGSGGPQRHGGHGSCADMMVLLQNLTH